MAHPKEISALNKAFTGLGVDEKTSISILTKWHPHQLHSYRKATPDFFIEDERQFERWSDPRVLQLRQEFIRFKDAVVLRTMHPWERDARLFKEALQMGPRIDIIIETACTRSSEDLLGARRAYHSLFHRSIEEDIASQIHTSERKLLVALVSAYRYEGPHVQEERAKSEAEVLYNAIKAVAKKNPTENEEVIMILATRSKSHIKAVYKYCEEISGNHLQQDPDGDWALKQTVQCLCTPHAYFSKILDASLRTDVDEAARDSVTRVILTRADVDIKQIKEEFQHKFSGVSLSKRIEEVANGNYRDFLLALVSKEN
ncbi:unnamed protein product [Coffea canephora]|uniref:DH200=94 genomic scaffold, scaffold_189 n=1 Tax=Coffea canephora TaxID=49390 RepID=A0A068VAQ6_COFCA|nr:unnamed protein product [Coffea canephora]